MDFEAKRAKAARQLMRIKRLTDEGMLLAADWKKQWQVLISTILSAQTRDEMTIKISHELYRKYPSIQKLAGARIGEIRRIIKPINYYKTKAKHIKETAKIITKKYNGKIPKTREELLELPGVGRKTANVFLAVQKKPAIGVDAHVASLARMLGWTKQKNPHKIEKELERLFPERYWIMINYILVRFGRTYKTRKRQKEKLIESRILT